jgi:hypothetical protein
VIEKPSGPRPQEGLVASSADTADVATMVDAGKINGGSSAGKGLPITPSPAAAASSSSSSSSPATIVDSSFNAFSGSTSSPARKERRGSSGKKRSLKRSKREGRDNKDVDSSRRVKGSRRGHSTVPGTPLSHFHEDVLAPNGGGVGGSFYGDLYGGGYVMLSGGVDEMGYADYHDWVGWGGGYGALDGVGGTPTSLGDIAYMDAETFESAVSSKGGLLDGLVGLGTMDVPADADNLHLLKDPAGRLQRFETLGGSTTDAAVAEGKLTGDMDSGVVNVVVNAGDGRHGHDAEWSSDKYRICTIFDDLEGIASRGDFEEHLKSPLVFHEMFLRSPGMGNGVNEVRRSLEERVTIDDNDYESWEQLGHVWRHYGNVPRTVDCYRKVSGFQQTN